MQSKPSNIDQALIPIADLIRLTSLSRSYIYLILNKKSKYYKSDFPKPFKIGTRKNYWHLNEVYQWLEAQKSTHNFA